MRLLSWQNLTIFSVALIPFSFALNPTPSVDLSVIRVLFPALSIYWILSSLLNKKIIIDKKLSFWFLLIFLFFCFVSTFWSTLKILALKKFLFLFSFLSVYFLVYALTSKKILREKLIKTLVLSSTFSSIFAIFIFSLQFILGLDTTLFIVKKISGFFLGNNFSSLVAEYPSWLVNIGGQTIMRTFGSFPDPHLFAIFTNLSLPFVFYMWSKTKKEKYLLFFFISILAVLLSFSRAAYLALFLGSFFILVYHLKPLKFLTKRFSLLIFLSFFVFAFLIIPNPLTKRFFSSFDLAEGSNSGRLEMWKLATETMFENPLGGVGLGNFARYNFPMSPEKNPIYAHNLFLDFASEIGILGTMSLLFIFLNKILVKNNSKNVLNKVISVSIFLLLIHSFFETPFYSVRVLPLFFLILGLNTND